MQTQKYLNFFNNMVPPKYRGEDLFWRVGSDIFCVQGMRRKKQSDFQAVEKTKLEIT